MAAMAPAVTAKVPLLMVVPPLKVLFGAASVTVPPPATVNDDGKTLSDNVALITNPGANPPLFTRTRLPPIPPAPRMPPPGVAPIDKDCEPALTVIRPARKVL